MPKMIRISAKSKLTEEIHTLPSPFTRIGITIFEHYQEIIDNALKSVFKHYLSRRKGKIPKVLYDAMYYSVFSNGKRIRPILLCLTYLTLIENQKPRTRNQKLKTKNLDLILPFACGIELVHTFSLIQDDLPSMDNDDFRRGKPSLHKAFGEGIAILASDALFALAFELFADALVDDKIKIQVIKELAKICGVKGLVTGQTYDLVMQITSLQSKIKSLRQKEMINQMKTAELMALAMKIGALISQSPDKIINNIENAGRNLGLLFQTVDDILDENHSSQIKSQKLKAQYYAHKAKHYINQLSRFGIPIKRSEQSELSHAECNQYFTVSDFTWFIDFVDLLLNGNVYT